MQTNGGARACKTYRLVVLLLLCAIPASVQYCRLARRQIPARTVRPQPVIYELLGTVAYPGIYRYAERKTPTALAAACEAEYAPSDRSDPTIADGSRIVFTGRAIAISRMDAAVLLSYHQPISLTEATTKDLELIPGIGPKTAGAVIEFRERAGPGLRIEQLIEVRGIGPKTLKKIAQYLRP